MRVAMGTNRNDKRLHGISCVSLPVLLCLCSGIVGGQKCSELIFGVGWGLGFSGCGNGKETVAVGVAGAGLSLSFGEFSSVFFVHAAPK